MNRSLVVACLLLPFAAFVDAAEPDCVAQRQVDVMNIAAQVILIGETHGTVELPAFVDGLVCSLLRGGKSVILAIEQDGDEQDGLNRYLKSPGNAADREALLQGRSWKTYADGRGSAAMFALIDSMRRLRGAGQRVGVIAFRRKDNFDIPMSEADRVHLTAEDNALQNRLNDQDMASTIQYAAILYRRYTVVVLAGAGHTSTILSRSTNPMLGTYMPMGQIVVAQMPVFAINFDVGGGEHWAMGASGGRSQAIEGGPLYVVGTQIDAVVRVDHLTASPPARDVIR